VFQIGDFLEAGDGSLDEVVDVRTSKGRGVFAPLTAEGTVVVNDVVVSCYAVVHSHSLAHMVYAPLRIAHNLQLSLRRLWDNSLRQLVVFPSPLNSQKTDEPTVGVHWYAHGLYSVAEYVLPTDWLYHV